jgi:hypothetical protein
MIAFFPLTLPIFGVIGLGWAIQRAKVLPSDLPNSLGWFSFHVALPGLVLQLTAQEPLRRSFYPMFFGAHLGVGAVIFALVVCVSGALRRSLESARAAVHRLRDLAPASTPPNSGQLS